MSWARWGRCTINFLLVLEIVCDLSHSWLQPDPCLGQDAGAGFCTGAAKDVVAQIYVSFILQWSLSGWWQATIQQYYQLASQNVWSTCGPPNIPVLDSAWQLKMSLLLTKSKCLATTATVAHYASEKTDQTFPRSSSGSVPPNGSAWVVLKQKMLTESQCVLKSSWLWKWKGHTLTGW